MYVSLTHVFTQKTKKKIQTKGIIFSNKNNETEIAFRTAIERANVFERSFELEPIVEYADTDDSFMVEKTG